MTSENYYNILKITDNPLRSLIKGTPNSKVRVANMGPTWVLAALGGPHVGPMNVAIRDFLTAVKDVEGVLEEVYDIMYITMYCINHRSIQGLIGDSRQEGQEVLWTTYTLNCYEEI